MRFLLYLQFDYKSAHVLRVSLLLGVYAGHYRERRPEEAAARHREEDDGACAADLRHNGAGEWLRDFWCAACYLEFVYISSQQ